MGEENKKVTARVPATTANLGSGYDTLGIALQLYNTIDLRRHGGAGIHLRSPVPEGSRDGAVAMLQETADLFFQRAEVPSFGLEIGLESEIPIARGLGSSVTLRLGLLGALNELTTAGLSYPQMLAAVTELEHHPDNAAPALFGGFCAAGQVGDEVRCESFSLPSSAGLVTLIPKIEVSTEAAREKVPSHYSKQDTVHAINRVALITAAFAKGNLKGLKGLFDDRIHQPYRAELVPGMQEVIRAGEEAGAIGGWLSGSGSTIICLTEENADGVASAMQQTLPDAEVKILLPDNAGLIVTRGG